jgi:hypothetical protein
MASIPFATGADRGEARFFFIMACVQTALIVAGFSLNIVMARSSFALPLVYHFHGVVMMTGLALYIAQTSLVFGGAVHLHRRLGWLAAAWVPLMVASGFVITRHALQATGGPPMFDQNHFLISNPLHLAGFAGLVAWAVGVRRNTGWHRRLMFCGFAMILGPGVGRLLPTPLFIPYAWYAVAVLPPLIFMAVGALADRRRYGRVHPAFWCGMGTMLGLQLAADLIAYSPLGYRFTEWFVAGTPGGARGMEAFFPPM